MHFHFGAGALGIGAVLPVLNRNQSLVIVQQVRKSGLKWDKYNKNNTICLGRRIEPPGRYQYQTSYTAEIPCVRVKRPRSVAKRMLPKREGDYLVVLLDELGQIGPVLRHATSLSCALRDGQSSLAKILLNNRGGNQGQPLLAFENKVNDKLTKACARLSCPWKLFHVLTDRICGKRIEDEDYGEILVPCEQFLRMVAANDDGVRSVFDEARVTTAGRGDEERPIILVAGGSLGFYEKRKRWMVNSLHEMLALIATSRLSQRRIQAEGQYLPQAIAWSLEQDPVLDHSVRLYIRLQAVRLVLECRKEYEAVHQVYGTYNEQELYDAFVMEGQDTFNRMREFSDGLGRLFNQERPDKEWKKYDEHVLGAMQFVSAREGDIRECHFLGVPNPDELKALEELLKVALRDSLA